MPVQDLAGLMHTIFMQRGIISWQTLCSKSMTQLRAMPCTMMSGRMALYPSI